MTEEEYAILNATFFDVEDFCKYPEIRDERDIDEGELKKRCKVALEKLKKLEKVAIDKSLYKNIGVNINSYIEFVDARLHERISVRCFKYIYKKSFLENTFRMTEGEHEILNGLYVDLDLLDGIELRKQCKITLEKLKMISEEKSYKKTIF
jgi:hypothetical protein